MAKVGRPAVYTGNLKRHIVALVSKHGLTGAQRILNASNAKSQAKLAKQRNLKLVPKALGISIPTLKKFAVEAGLEFELGRPKAA